MVSALNIAFSTLASESTAGTTRSRYVAARASIPWKGKRICRAQIELSREKTDILRL